MFNKQGTKNKSKLRHNSAQALLIVVVFMGAIMLGMSVISGYLFTQRLRTSVDITNSTRAIFAADAGIETQLYDIFKNNGYSSLSTASLSGSAPGGATFEASRTYKPTFNGFSIESLGTSEFNSGRIVSRQLELNLTIFGSSD